VCVVNVKEFLIGQEIKFMYIIYSSVQRERVKSKKF